MGAAESRRQPKSFSDNVAFLLSQTGLSCVCYEEERRAQEEESMTRNLFPRVAVIRECDQALRGATTSDHSSRCCSIPWFLGQAKPAARPWLFCYIHPLGVWLVASSHNSMPEEMEELGSVKTAHLDLPWLPAPGACCRGLGLALQPG